MFSSECRSSEGHGTTLYKNLSFLQHYNGRKKRYEVMKTLGRGDTVILIGIRLIILTKNILVDVEECVASALKLFTVVIYGFL
jgi:hypothetical protein